MNPIGKLKISKPDEPEPNVGRAPPGMAGIARHADAMASCRNTTGASKHVGLQSYPPDAGPHNFHTADNVPRNHPPYDRPSRDSRRTSQANIWLEACG